MEQNSTKHEAIPELMQAFWELLAAHRGAFKQERPYQRAVALVFGELFAFARHTVTQGLLALGLTDADWSGFYRLFSRARFDVGVLWRLLFRETLLHSPAAEPYVTGMDTTQMPRTGKKMPGAGWLPAPRTPVFKRGIHQAQRFLHGAWLPPMEAGSTRAITLQLRPAFPPKARPAAAQPTTEWQAGLDFVRWVREELDAAGREGQLLLTLGDGAYDTVGMWRGLPQRTVVVVRTAKNRRLRELPGPYSGRGRRRKYGPVAPKPETWPGEWRSFQQINIVVRGRTIHMRYRVLGPYYREQAPDTPLFLIVVGGASWKAGKRNPKTVQRQPAYYLVNAVRQAGRWQLPLAIRLLLTWLWQRWELEVAHREMKGGFGVGQMQCWNPRSAVVSVQWMGWVYGLLVLAAYRTWGLLGGPKRAERWWPGAKRWSFNTLWRAYRQAMWGNPEFRALWTPTRYDWTKKEAWLMALGNAALAAARA